MMPTFPRSSRGFGRRWLLRSCVMYSVSDWSLCSRPSWISSRTQGASCLVSPTAIVLWRPRNLRNKRLMSKMTRHAASVAALRDYALLLSDPGGRTLSASGTMESSMSKAGLDNRHRNKDGEISHKHGNTLIRTLRKIYGRGFAAGYPETEKL